MGGFPGGGAVVFGLLGRFVTMAIRAKGPLTFPGGKGMLVNKLLPLIPPHRIYVEVFGGGAHLLFAKKPAPVEIYNDIDSDLVNFFRVLRDPQKSAELCRLLELTPYSREEHDYACAILQKSEGLSDIERAYFFFVCTQQSFAGYYNDAWSYRVTETSRGMASGVSRWWARIESLPEFANRLLTVQIEHDDFRKIIPRYDTPETLFYCDPPYVPEARRTRDIYSHEMTLEDHEDLVSLLLECKGMVILSGYRHSVYEPLERAGWQRYDFQVSCHLAGSVRGSSLLGAGSKRKSVPRVESVWLNPQAERGRGSAVGFWGGQG